jgi:hypothetical protein
MEPHRLDDAGDLGGLPPPNPAEQKYKKGWRRRYWFRRYWFTVLAALLFIWSVFAQKIAAGNGLQQWRIALGIDVRQWTIFWLAIAFLVPLGTAVFFRRIPHGRDARSGNPPPPGWYPDPHQGHGIATARTGKLRYFDGTTWTDEIRGYPTDAEAWGSHPRSRVALGVVVLAGAAILTVLACEASTRPWVCTTDGSRVNCGPQWIGPIPPGYHSFLDPYVQAGLTPPLWTAGIFNLRRYHRKTYALSPIAGIVSGVIFAHHRNDWTHNCFAFLACVFLTTAVCVLFAWGITRSVAPPQRQARPLA